MTEGWRGWDDYAPFYDWENARTLQRRDVAFWQRLAAAQDGPVLELGCGTGRIAVPIARAGARIVGIDRSRDARPRAHPDCAGRGSVVTSPSFAATFAICRSGSAVRFSAVLAAYGILQSLTRERDLTRDVRVGGRGAAPGRAVRDRCRSRSAPVGGIRNRVSLTGVRGRGTRLTLVETVRQDRRRRLTIFDQEYRETQGRRRRVHRFSLTFRTLSVPQMTRRLERAGFRVQAVLGDYQGGPWDPRADVWVILAAKR